MTEKYCPICQPRPSGESVVVVHHSKCLKPIIQREEKKLEQMERASKQQDIFEALVEITHVIAGNR